MSSGCSVVIKIVVCLLVYCVYKISIKANIQVVNREKGPVHQICMQEPHFQVPSVVDMAYLTGSDIIAYL